MSGISMTSNVMPATYIHLVSDFRMLYCMCQIYGMESPINNTMESPIDTTQPPTVWDMHVSTN